jgi:uncharacterized membrane protein YbaN (DUF454 family)
MKQSIRSSTRVVLKRNCEGKGIADSSREERTGKGLLRILMVIAGTLFVGLGILGIFLPLLPTTPFLLLAAACYSRGSKRFYDWLLNNRWFGNYIRDYREKKQVPLAVKVGTLSLLWTAIILSALLVVHILLVRIILILIAVGVTLHILSIPTLRR